MLTKQTLEALGVTLLFGGLFTWRLRNFSRGWMSRSWPHVQGSILSSSLDSSFGRGGPSYTPRVIYSYRVEGSQYNGERLDFADTVYTFEARGQRRIAPYEVGAVVDVSYDPHSHGRSVLEPGVRFSLYMWLLFFGSLFAIGILELAGVAA